MPATIPLGNSSSPPAAMNNLLCLPTLGGLGFNDGGTRADGFVSGMMIDALVPKELSSAAAGDTPAASVTASSTSSAAPTPRDNMFDDFLNFEMPSPDTPLPNLDLLGQACTGIPALSSDTSSMSMVGLDPFSPLGTGVASELSSPATSLPLSPLAQPLFTGGVGDYGSLLLPYQNVSPTFKAPAPVMAQPLLGSFPYPGAYVRGSPVVVEDSKYKERRKKNNESAKKCRQKKKEEESKTQSDNGKLAAENAQLKARIEVLEEQLASLKALIASKL
eukprot:comp12795_c0_seq1/m.7938 comp12795_c0_seq1/g.7938  ORF comp12795_c0_seq1/g.7938 comp12795_c0_seq1/m.7938 type:complete len:276 (-) comp12795_c0_seq1:183-1010(-)